MVWLYHGRNSEGISYSLWQQPCNKFSCWTGVDDWKSITTLKHFCERARFSMSREGQVDVYQQKNYVTFFEKCESGSCYRKFREDLKVVLEKGLGRPLLSPCFH